MVHIPQHDELKGREMAFRLQRETRLPHGPHREAFGALLNFPFTLKLPDETEKTYPYVGWLGKQGSPTTPIVAEFIENPTRTAKGEGPSFRLYTVINGELSEIVAAFRRESETRRENQTTPTVYYTARLGESFLSIWKHVPRTEDSRDEENLEDPQV